MQASTRISLLLLLLLGCHLLKARGQQQQQQCTPDLPSMETIRSEARLIGNLISRPTEQNLIPGIGFTCSGVLTRWVIVATFVSGGDRFPELQIFRPVINNAVNRTGYSQFHENNRTTVNVYENRPDPPLQFERGDVLGIHSPPNPILSFQYQENGGPTNYYLEGIEHGYDRLTLDEGYLLRDRNDVPLVAVEVSNPECISGFMDIDTLMIKASTLSSILNRQGEQAIIPDIGFNCSGLLTSWIILATVESQGTGYPEFQLFRAAQGDQISRANFTVFDERSLVAIAENVYEFRPNPPIQFESGDVLGIFSPPTPRLSFKYQEVTGPINYYRGGVHNALSQLSFDGTFLSADHNDLPILTVEVSNPECLTGFIDLDTLLIKASIFNSDVTTREATQIIIPELAFPCAGIIQSFMLAALDLGRTSERVSYPEIQIWRQSIDDQNVYTKIAAVGNGGGVLTRNESLNVYVYEPIPPIEVEAGDIIGFHQPSQLSSRHELYLRNGGPVNHYSSQAMPLDTFNTSDSLESSTMLQEMLLPLISANFSQQGTIPTINTTAVPPAATTPPSSNTGQTTEGTLVPPTQDTLVPPTQDTLVPPTLANVQSVGEIVAIAVCVALSVLLAVSCGAVLTAVVVHRCRKRRRRRNVLPTDCVPKSTSKDSLDYNAIYRASTNDNDTSEYSVLRRAPIPVPYEFDPDPIQLKKNKAYTLQPAGSSAASNRMNAPNRLAVSEVETIENRNYSQTNIYEYIN